MSSFVKRRTKDSVFTYLFSDVKYVAQMYRALHPEDKDFTDDMVKIVTLENILTNGIYNDLGFTVNDKLIFLVEAQSTWSENIIIRSLLYLAQSYQDYIDENELNLYSGKKISIPKPELYVIHTGNNKVDKKYISLSEEFWNGEITSVDVRVRVLTESEKGNIIYQYIAFSKVFDDQVKLYGYTQKAILETIRICLDDNILDDFLKSRESEVYDIMFALFDEEKYRKLAMKEIEEEAIEEGRAKGIEEGRAEGRAEERNTLIESMKKNGLSEEQIQKILSCA